MSDAPAQAPGAPAPRDYGSTIGRTLDLTQAAIYLIAAIFLALLAVLVFILIAEQIASLANQPLEISLIDSVLENILIVFIITGLIQTLIVYIKSHTIDPWLVLSVGLTAMIRRILVFGANPRPWEEELLTAALLFVIIVGMYLIGKFHRVVAEAER
jgi:uncharacterized membrane protein (DUF373 family)